MPSELLHRVGDSVDKGSIAAMVNEFRTYQLRTGDLPRYLEAFEEIALPLVRKHMHLLGFWTSDTGTLNCVHHLWAFEDHLRREERYAALRAEPDYRERFLPIAAPLIVSMHSRVLQPVAFMKQLPLNGIPGETALAARG